jgi:hypothetical protein
MGCCGLPDLLVYGSVNVAIAVPVCQLAGWWPLKASLPPAVSVWQRWRCPGEVGTWDIPQYTTPGSLLAYSPYGTLQPAAVCIQVCVSQQSFTAFLGFLRSAHMCSIFLSLARDVHMGLPLSCSARFLVH